MVLQARIELAASASLVYKLYKHRALPTELLKQEPTVGIEPTTSRLEGGCSIQMSYAGNVDLPRIERRFQESESRVLTDYTIGLFFGLCWD